MIENIRLSFQGIISHKIRSLLTMLGIIIGIAAIIAIVSTIEGTNEVIKNNLIGGGTNTVRIKLSNGDPDMGYYDEDMLMNSNIRVVSESDKKRITDLKEVEKCTLYRQKNYCQNIYFENQNLSFTTIYGIDEDYFDTEGYVIAEGMGFSEAQFKDYSKVAIVDSSFAKSVLNGDSAIGKFVDISNEPFMIIGVAVKRSDFEPTINTVDEYYTYDQSQGGMVFIPTNDWSICFNFDVPQQCTIRAVDTNSMTSAGKNTADILNENVRKPDPDEVDAQEMSNTVEYKSESMLEKAQAQQDLSKSTNKMLIMIASISLLVGGIGVMNIMLVSVTERTREIGLKKALGARKGKILAQFLTEAAVLTTLGGIVGVLSGIGLAKVMSNISGTPVSISTIAIVVSVAFSMVVGIVFGFIPSVKAAKLNPIDALRYE